MKVLQLITDQKRRGAQVFAGQLSDGLALKGHDVVLVSMYETQDTTVLTTDCAEIIALNGKKSALSLDLILRLRRLIRERSPEIIQANGSDTLKLATLASFGLPKKPILVYRNISMVGSWIRSGLHRFLYARLFSQVDHVASLTEITRREFISVYKFSASKISIIPIGTNIPSSMDPRRHRKNLEAATKTVFTGPVLLHIGAFTPEKNHEGLLRIFEQVRMQIPTVSLVLVGDGPRLSGIKDYVKSRGLSESVFFLGSRSDIDEWNGGADLFLMTSHIEGLPGVVLEAMAHRVPVVGFDVGAMKEVLDERAGIVVARGDELSFSNAVVALVKDDEGRRAISDAAFTRVQKNYSLEFVTTRFEHLYRNLVEERK